MAHVGGSAATAWAGIGIHRWSLDVYAVVSSLGPPVTVDRG